MELKPNIVLDLDETLIHCIVPDNEEFHNKFKQLKNYFFSLYVNNISLCVFYRPYLFDFLSYINNKFNIYISTNSSKIYAMTVLQNILKYLPTLQIQIIRCRINPTDPIYAKSLDQLNNFQQNKLSCANDKTNTFSSSCTIDETNTIIDETNTIIIDDRVDVWESRFLPNIIQIKEFDIYKIVEMNDTILNIDNELNKITTHIDNLYKLYIEKNINMSQYILFYYLIYKLQ